MWIFFFGLLTGRISDFGFRWLLFEYQSSLAFPGQTALGHDVFFFHTHRMLGFVACCFRCSFLGSGRIYWSVLFCSSTVSLCFGHLGNASFIKGVGKFSPLFCFLEEIV